MKVVVHKFSPYQIDSTAVKTPRGVLIVLSVFSTNCLTPILSIVNVGIKVYDFKTGLGGPGWWGSEVRIFP